MTVEGEGPVQHDVLHLVYDGCDRSEIVEACGHSADTALTTLVRLGMLERTGRGKYAITHKGKRHIGVRDTSFLRVVS